MERITDAAAAVESTVDSMVAVLDTARLAQSPAVPPAQLRVLTIIANNNRQTNMSRLAEAAGDRPTALVPTCPNLRETLDRAVREGRLEVS